MYDIAIVGAGPAGMTAALYALRADKKVLLIEKENFGGQITYSPKVENYPTQMQISGSELAQMMLDQVMEHGAVIELAEVTGIVNHGDTKTVVTDMGEFEAKAVILATGSKHRHLGLSREEEFIGNGISFCAVCDGAFFSGTDVAVVGGGNTALQEALMLSEYCTHVTVIQNLSFMTGEARLLSALEKKENVSFIYDTTVTEFLGENKLEGLRLQNSKTGESHSLVLEGVFIAIGQQPDNQRFAELTALNEIGYIIADERCMTDTDGIFVAGDCRTKAIRQVTTAAADGSIAALAACRYLENL
ncbi:MAG: FAD-dependent oxidoreductase [Ruminococcaceae bacterium]|nr:FAD-dependent oxidoreductase [Oscillospiraceae bacterium]